MNKIAIYIIPFVLLALGACQEESKSVEVDVIETELIDISDWSESSHSNNVEPNYQAVFRENEVLRFDIKINAAEWTTMLNDLQANIGSGPNGGPGQMTDFDPVWVTSSVFFDGIEWYKVGIRFKGNSSLHSTYRSGISKLSFKLDFDQFEDQFPQLKNQRFYGFKQLNLKNNFEDPSMMREKVASDLFREFGLVSSRAAYCELYVDYGEGAQYFGVYTLVEEVDDTLLDSQLGDDSGNLYKPDGPAASFASGTFDEGEMEKKNNEDEADYSDVANLYAYINADKSADKDQWKVNLEHVFDTDAFLKWLAANTTMQNWDTYGVMTHNYYLYHHHENGLLTWIPWDNNESMQEGKQGGALSLSMDEVGNDWPLIRYLLDDPVYKQNYDSHMKSFVESVFTAEKMIQLYDSNYSLIKEFAYAEVDGYTFLANDQSFDMAVDQLKSHVEARGQLVKQYLGP